MTIPNPEKEIYSQHYCRISACATFIGICLESRQHQWMLHRHIWYNFLHLFTKWHDQHNYVITIFYSTTGWYKWRNHHVILWRPDSGEGTTSAVGKVTSMHVAIGNTCFVHLYWKEYNTGIFQDSLQSAFLYVLLSYTTQVQAPSFTSIHNFSKLRALLFKNCRQPAARNWACKVVSDIGVGAIFLLYRPCGHIDLLRPICK